MAYQYAIDETQKTYEKKEHTILVTTTRKKEGKKAVTGHSVESMIVLKWFCNFNFLINCWRF
jgi:hypothetical protein